MKLYLQKGLALNAKVCNEVGYMTGDKQLTRNNTSFPENNFILLQCLHFDCTSIDVGI